MKEFLDKLKVALINMSVKLEINITQLLRDNIKLSGAR